MLNSFIKAFYCFSFLCLVSCQPVEMTSTDKYLPDDSSLFSNPQDKFKDVFVSDKLDLVFVLDTHPDMKKFYKKNLFGSNFLSRFQKYDWRFAYTDMSVDVDSFSKQKEKKDEEEEKSCGFWSGLVMTAGGVAANAPLISALGLKSLFNCATQALDFSDDEETTAKSFANGAFLPLEYKGKKLTYNGLNYMPKSVANYNEIFNHTITLGNTKEDDDYEAPEIKDLESYPFLSTALSLANGNRPSNTNSHDNKLSFFREMIPQLFMCLSLFMIYRLTSQQSSSRKALNLSLKMKDE